MNYTREEKVKIIVDIAKNLKNFPAKNGGTVNLYNNEYTFLEKFKSITMQWIQTDNSEYEGFLYFEEINKYFEYKFPSKKNKEPLFVLRHNHFFKD